MKVSYKKWKLNAKKELKERIKREGKPMIFLKLTLPILLALIASGIFYSLGPQTYIPLLKLLGVYMFTPIGSGIGVPVGFELGLGNVLMAVFMLTVDALTSMFIIWNLDYVRIVPLLGRLVKITEEKALELRERKPWIRNLEFIGVAIFVFIPLYGTGAIIGSIIGKLLDMKPLRIWLAVMLGSAMRILILILLMKGILFLI